jgi:hypothetical protein
MGSIVKTIVVGALVVAALAPTTATANANDTGAARERMTAQLFAERGSEVSYKDAGDPSSGLVFLEEVECGGEVCRSWRPARLAVSCRVRVHARPHFLDVCTGRLVVDDEDGGPIGENGPVGETYVALVDHATFRGRKGTYHETGWNPPS